MPPAVRYLDVAEAVRAEAARRRWSLESLGGEIGWDVEPLVRNPSEVGRLNLVALHAVCRAVGLDWVGVLGGACGAPDPLQTE